MSEQGWSWRPHGNYWVQSSDDFTATLFRGVSSGQNARRERVWIEAPGQQEPQKVARYEVAICGPAWPERGCAGNVERYVLRASLVDVRRKLRDAMRRRQAAWDERCAGHLLG